jgi:hypothetical protein
VYRATNPEKKNDAVRGDQTRMVRPPLFFAG